MKTLDETQYRYTPDPGVVQEDVFCGVCGTKTEVTRCVSGPRTHIQAICKINEKHDLFICPNRYEAWHENVVNLRKEAQESASEWFRAANYAEADILLKDVGMKTRD